MLPKSKSTKYSEYLPYYFIHNKKNFRIKKVNLPSKLKRNYRITLDYKKDLLMFNEMIKKSVKKTKDLMTVDIFKILDQNPQIANINSSLKLKYVNKNFQKNLKKITKLSK